MKPFTWSDLPRMLGPHAAGGSLVGGPPRMVHHITWDRLGPKGGRPPIASVGKYLVEMGYEPHLLLDPILGGGYGFLPFDRSAYSLENPPGGAQTNRQGTACIQVEWLFSPGCVVNGKRYETLLDTPMKGLDLVLEVADAYGVPRDWPMGEPTWKANRDARTWLLRGGHYGHSQVPENTHTDPGPMTLPTKEFDTMLDPKDKEDLIQAITGGVRPRDHHDTDQRYVSNADVLSGVEKSADRIIAALAELKGDPSK